MLTRQNKVNIDIRQIKSKFLINMTGVLFYICQANTVELPVVFFEHFAFIIRKVRCSLFSTK